MGQTKGFLIILGFALFARESFLFSDDEILGSWTINSQRPF